MQFTDTIFAFATPPGTSGVAVLRVSGQAASSFYRIVTRRQKLPTPRQAVLARIYEPESNQLLDQALMLYFPAPHSFTGEDVLELHLHGSMAIRHAVMRLCEAQGLRHAEPGEFTRRAYTNDKMDLLQLEGLSDILQAHTPRQLQQAWRQAAGDMGAEVMAMRARIMRPLALLEAYIDFPDEDIPDAVLREVSALRSDILQTLAQWLEGQGGEKIREGYEILIMGPPNVGKSSLMNRLAGRDMAIVTDEAGTTRDMIELHMDIGGYAVTFVDTAGLRETDAHIEALGVAAARKRASKADMILALISHDTDPEQSLEMLDSIEVPTIYGQSKADAHDAKQVPWEALAFSAKTGEGIEGILAAIASKLDAISGSHASPMITRARHRQLFHDAKKELEMISDTLPLELCCEHWRRASHLIGNITGKMHQDELLDIIFREFCIGK
jgi:tRNA modification GTPase